MVRKARTPVLAPLPRKGHSISPFRKGDESKWAEIVTSVGEFENEPAALAHFRKKYMPHLPELRRRLLFMQTSRGEKAGTFTAWWDFIGDRRIVSLHWLAVRPEYQGLGIGKALVFKCLQRAMQIDGDQDVYLHTQTWSHRAIGIYLQAGFEFMKEGSLRGYRNDNRKAIPILKDKLKTP